MKKEMEALYLEGRLASGESPLELLIDINTDSISFDRCSFVKKEGGK